MAVAVEALPAAAEAAEGGEAAAAGTASAGTAPRPRSSSADWLKTGGALYGRVSTPSAAAQTVGKIIWAVALGLIVLELAAQATGQTWSLDLGQGAGGQKPVKGAYLPLYAGQSSPASAAMPGVFSGPVSVQGPDTNLSGRAGGSLAAP